MDLNSSNKNNPTKFPSAYDAFLKDKIDLKPLLNSYAKISEVRKTLKQYQGEFGYNQKRHLLNRVLVGYAERHMKDLDGLNLDQAIDLIFKKPDLGEPVNNYYHDFPAEEYKKTYLVDDVKPGEPFISKALSREERQGIPAEFAGRERASAYDSWTYASIYSQPTTVAWRLFLFLHTLTPYKEDNVRLKALYYSFKLTYEGAWRNYKDYIYDVTLSDNMLYFLNLKSSKKEAPDENFAREVQELFTVGKRPFSKFTEADVKAAARLLVGWDSLYIENLTDEGFVTKNTFREDNHDTGDKQFSKFYGNRLIKGRKGPDGGKLELKEFYDMIFETDEVAIYLSRRLVQFFVYPVLNDYVEVNIIKPLAEILRKNNYCLAEALKVLLKSEYFFADEFYNAMIKSPMEYSMGLYKEFDLIKGHLTRYENNVIYNSFFDEDKKRFDAKYFDPIYLSYRLFKDVKFDSIGRQGYNFGNPPSVAGWQAYYQEPVYDLIWINSDSIKRRKELAESIIRNGIGLSERAQLRFNLNVLLKKTKDPSDINSFIRDLAKLITGTDLNEKAFVRIKKSILGDNLPDYYWTDAVRSFQNSPNYDNYNTLFGRVGQILSQIIDLNEIHVF
jgi:hypothetical protein